MTGDIVAFLLARIEDDEAVARAAIDPERPGAHWHWINVDDDTPAVPDEYGELPNVSLRTVERFPTSSGVGPLPAFPLNNVEALRVGPTVHIARWDPARVLTECESKRRIVARHGADRVSTSRSDPRATEIVAGVGVMTVCETCSTHDQYADDQHVLFPCPELRDLASVYRSHPDYQETWRP